MNSEQTGCKNLIIILDSAVQDDKAMQDFESESLLMGADHSQKVKAAPIKSDYGSKDCVDLSSSTAESRLMSQQVIQFLCELNQEGLTVVMVTHDMNVASYAKRRLTLANGSVVDETASKAQNRPCKRF